MPHRSRILDGGCRWETIAEVQPAIDALQNQDSFALAGLIGMQRDATQVGLIQATWIESLDYRAPIQRAPKRVVSPPWLGELKYDGKGRRGKAGLTWRMYFSEPIEPAGLVVVCGLGWKDPNERKSQADKRQNDSIRRAMKLFQRFCGQNSYTYPPFEPC